MEVRQTAEKLIAENRKARHDYFVMETLEAGIELVGTEVKSIRAGTVNLKDSWVEVENGELFVHGMHISPYEKGNIFNRDPLRERKLLVHRREIRHLADEKKLKGYTIVPLKLYFKRGKVKVALGLCKGKKLYDKRADMAARAAKRDIDRALKSQNR
ncbi:SsrA-binding protein SmpB [Ruthenibacterium sp. CLA-JM-H11]|uniref:SsrA-binding protein n=1 Tax=Ruthenibacterium intestinale TaxID=3133163 RepID=A0ABV1GIQ6_9FIRM